MINTPWSTNHLKGHNYSGTKLSLFPPTVHSIVNRQVDIKSFGS